MIKYSIEYQRMITLSTPNQINHNICLKYDSMFHFYLSKGINQLVKKKSHSLDVILFQDLQFLDQREQFLKRYYRKQETPKRIQLLSNYFFKCRLLPEQVPCIVGQNARKYMFKRIKRYGKLKKRLEEMNKQQENDIFIDLDEKYLCSVQTSQLNNSSQAQFKQNISYDSVVHDIYASSSNAPLKVKIQKRILPLELSEEDQDILILEPKHLVCDFQTEKKNKPHPKLYLDLNQLTKKQSFDKKNISSLSPRVTSEEDQIGFLTSRQSKEKQSNLYKFANFKGSPNKNYVQSYFKTQKDKFTSTDWNYKLKKNKEYIPTELKSGTRSSYKEHQQYIRILQKISKKYRSPQLTKKSPSNHIKKSKTKVATQVNAGFNPSRLDTLRYKALKLIGDTKSIRQAKSSDPTVRYI